VSGRNPDLPILDELGAELAALAAAAVAAERRPGGGTEPAVAAPAPAAAAPTAEVDDHTARRRAPAMPSRARRERGAQARRISRRAAIVLVLICLVGGVAFAALRGGGSDGHGHTTPALLGRDPGGAWSFSAYRDGSRLCTVFVPRGGELSGSCGPAPGSGQLRAGSAIVAGHRYVFGVAGPGVARASISITENGQTHGAWRTGVAGVHRPADRDAATDAGVPPADAWFVADLGAVRRGDPSAAPAVVTPFTRHGHRAGPPYVDCSLGELAPACMQRIRSAARG
jgi:hypothetical protein